MNPTEEAPRYARRMAGMKASEIRELLKLTARADVISFAGGIPDPELFPVEAARAAYAQALADPAVALQYGPSEGYEPLREWIAAEMTREGAPAAPENILVVAGANTMRLSYSLPSTERIEEGVWRLAKLL